MGSATPSTHPSPHTPPPLLQGSLQSLFQMLAYMAGVVVWQPERFPILMAGSCGVVLLASSVFTAYALATAHAKQAADVQIAVGQ